MKITGSSTSPTRVVVELRSGAKVSLAENRDGTLSIHETTHRLLTVQPDARNAVTLSFPMPAGVSD